MKTTLINVLFYPNHGLSFTGDDPNNPGHPRPAYVCHMRANVKYSPKKMWHVANMVLGLSVEDALKQLSFVSAKGALIAKEVSL